MNLRCLLAALALMLAALAMGCGAEDTLEEVTGSTQQPLSTPDFRMPQNGLNPWAADVNRKLLKTLRSNKLNSSALNSILSANADIRNLFNTGKNTSAEKVMEEIVSCALDWGKDVTVTVNGATLPTWKGQFGLCGTMSQFGSWWDNNPSPACLAVVSGCVLARMNALDRLVPISIRVPNASGFQPVSQVRVQTTLRDRTNTGSGWQPEFVGICKRNELVTLQRNGETMVRVCKGIHGCENNSQTQSCPGFSPYAGFVEEFAADSDYITFTCPPDVGAAPSGSPDHTYFSIMVAPAIANPIMACRPPDPFTAPITYPATEREVFTYPEGAFYGDIFPLVAASTIGTGWVCHSELWQAGKAYLADRLCADPNASEHCSPLAGHSSCQTVCGAKSPAPEEAYYDCSTDIDSWKYALTVFLNDPHDLSSVANASAIVCTPHNECTSGAKLPNGCSPVVTSICAVDPYCCTTAWDDICVKEVRTVANSQECNPDTCSHPVCTTGVALTNGCNSVVTSICAVDPYCCSTEWDRICVDEVRTVANDLKCVAGTCGHTLCTTGNNLTSGCDVPPLASSCVASVCAADPYCCNTAWDSICINAVQSVCGKSCL